MFKITDKYLKLLCCMIVATFLGSIAVAGFTESLYVKAFSVVITALSALGIINVVTLLLIEAIYLSDPQNKEQHEHVDQQL